MAEATWRDEDEALFQRLADRARLQSLWAAERSAGPPPHDRAAGLIALLRRTPEGGRAAALADDGDVSALVALVRPSAFDGSDPRLVHHLALYHERLARQRNGLQDWQAALGAWLALGAHPDYLATLARAVVGDALDEGARAAWAEEAGWAAWNRLIAAAEAGAADRAPVARTALQLLDDVQAIAKRAGIDAEELERRAGSARARILDAALAPIDEALDEAEGRAASAAHVQALEATVELWRWAGRPAQVERFFVDRGLSIGWQLYKSKSYLSLRRLDQAGAPLLDRFAERIETDPRAISYASRVGQFMVFRAEMEPLLARQIEAAERAVALCDTHRNGRLVLADLLAERALRSLEDLPLIGRREHLRRASADVERARELWPEASRRLDQAEAELRRRGANR